jgi:hypothetical protein
VPFVHGPTLVPADERVQIVDRAAAEDHAEKDDDGLRDERWRQRV